MPCCLRHAPHPACFTRLMKGPHSPLSHHRRCTCLYFVTLWNTCTCLNSKRTCSYCESLYHPPHPPLTPPLQSLPTALTSLDARSAPQETNAHGARQSLAAFQYLKFSPLTVGARCLIFPAQLPTHHVSGSCLKVCPDTSTSTPPMSPNVACSEPCHRESCCGSGRGLWRRRTPRSRFVDRRVGRQQCRLGLLQTHRNTSVAQCVGSSANAPPISPPLTPIPLDTLS
jgi:hypothetical protein